MSWVEESKFSAERFSDLTRVWRDVWGLWRDCDEYFH